MLLADRGIAAVSHTAVGGGSGVTGVATRRHKPLLSDVVLFSFVFLSLKLISMVE